MTDAGDGESGSDGDGEASGGDAGVDELAEPVETIMPVGHGSGETPDQADAAGDARGGVDDAAMTDRDEFNEFDELDELDLDEFNELAPPVPEVLPVGCRPDVGDAETAGDDESGASDMDGGTDD